MPDETNNNLWAAVGKYGVATVFAMILLYILRFDMILPANQERGKTTDALVEANKSNTRINESLTQSYQKLTSSVEAQTRILTDIRDDTRKFPAVREANAKGPEP